MNRVLAVTIAALALALGGCDWLKTLGTKDNVEPPTELAELAPSVVVQSLWSAKVGGGAGDSGARMSPCVADGRVYAAGIDGSIAAFDAQSGNELWRIHAGERTGSFLRHGVNSLRWTGGPAVSGDLLVVGGLDGEVYAYSTADGSVRWNTSVGSEIIAPPAIGNGVVVVHSNDGHLTALDAGNGSNRWVYDEAVPPLNLRGSARPVIGEDKVFSGLDNGKVVALELDNGHPAWTQVVSAGEGGTDVERLADVDGSLALDGSVLYTAGYRGQIVALSTDRGLPQWQRDLSSYAGAAVGNDSVVVVDSDGNVWSFDRTTGANRWKQDKLLHRWLSPPAIVGSTVVVGDLEGYVHWLSLDDGKLAARERLGHERIEGAPVVEGNTVFIEDIDGRVGAYRVGQ
jgi:outer membrane protein assembly factor BamB